MLACSLKRAPSKAKHSHETNHILLWRRVTLHLIAGGAAGPPGAHAGAEGPGHVRTHPHQHAVAHQEGGKRQLGEPRLLQHGAVSLAQRLETALALPVGVSLAVKWLILRAASCAIRQI